MTTDPTTSRHSIPGTLISRCLGIRSEGQGLSLRGLATHGLERAAMGTWIGLLLRGLRSGRGLGSSRGLGWLLDTHVSSEKLDWRIIVVAEAVLLLLLDAEDVCH